MKKRILSFLLAVVLILSCAACEKKDDASRDDPSAAASPYNDASQGSTAFMSEEVTIKNDVDASYFHDFVNLIPFYQDVPYVAIKGDDLHPDLTYNWYSMVKTTTAGEYPYARLRTAYDYALSDIYAVNGRQKDEFEMAQYFKCTNSVNTFNTVSMEVDTWNAYDGLLWYLTFLNYQCTVETEEDQYGTLVHVKISNTDMVKLLYEELKNTYNMVQEDNRAEAEKRISSSFDHVKTYFKEEEENYSRLDHIDRVYTRIAPGIYSYSDFPVYGSSFITGLNLVELAGKLIYEGAKYQQNKAYWGNLSDDGTLYYYTLCQMILRMSSGDYDTVNSELTFYAEVDSEGNGYLPFDYRKNYTSFTQADEQWDGAIADILASKGLASQTCSMSNIQSGDNIFTWGSAADQDYENMVFWDIMGWRGSIAPGRSVTDYPQKIGYTGLVEEVSDEVYQDVPVKLVEGKSVQADRDPATGYYEVDGVLYDLSGGEAKAVGTVDGFSQTDLTLPKDINGCPVTTVGEQAFDGCEALKTLAIPEGVRVLEFNALSFCLNLTSVSLPTTLQEIGQAAFLRCDALREINIPDGVKICDSAFLSCISLEEVVIPSSVKELGNYAFDNCLSLHIWLPKPTKVGAHALRGVAEVSYGRPGSGGGNSTQSPSDYEPESYVVQLPSPTLNFGSGFYERYALQSRTSSTESYYLIGSNTLYHPTLPNLKFTYDEDGFLSVLDISYTLERESAEGQLKFSYEKDADGKAAACTVSGNLYDIALFDRDRDKNRQASGNLFAQDWTRAERTQNGLPFQIAGEPSAPEHLVEGLLSLSALSNAQDALEKLLPIATDLLNTAGIDFEAETGMPLEEVLVEEDFQQDILEAAIEMEICSAEEARQIMYDLYHASDVAYAHGRLMTVLGETNDEKKELVFLRDEYLAEYPGRYFWWGSNRTNNRLTISSSVNPVGSVGNVRECKMTVDEKQPGKPLSAYLTDGTDIFEYIFTYDSQGQITDISYYQYTNGRQRDDSTKRQQYIFTYDANGRYTGFEYSYNGSVTHTASYAYDDQGRLIRQSYNGHNGVQSFAEVQNYEYDDAGFVCRVTEQDMMAAGKPVYVYEPMF